MLIIISRRQGLLPEANVLLIQHPSYHRNHVTKLTASLYFFCEFSFLVTALIHSYKKVSLLLLAKIPKVQQLTSTFIGNVFSLLHIVAVHLKA